MTVAELIDYLQQFPPQTKVYIEEGYSFLHKGPEGFIVLEGLYGLRGEEPL